MRIIEFIGPPGIGKTTILQELKKSKKIEFIDMHEGALLAIRDSKILLNEKEKLLLSFTRLIPSKKYKNILINILIEKALDKSFKLNYEKYNVVIVLFLKKLCKKETFKSSHLNSVLIFYKFLKWFILLNESKADKTVVLDQDISRSSSLYSFEGSLKEIQDILPAKIIAFDIMDENIYVNRRLKRSKRLFGEHDMTDEKLKKRALDSLRGVREQVEKFQKKGFNIKVIKTDKKISEIVEEVETAININ